MKSFSASRFFFLSCVMLLELVAAEDEKTADAEEEPLLGFLDYVLLAAIGGVCFWWFYWRDRDSDKIPEVVHIDIQNSSYDFFHSMRSSPWW